MELNEQQYNLYMQIARKYAANLPDEKDRIKAFKWLKKIHSTDAKASKTKNHALNILIICLQRKRLVGPFKIGPKEDKALTSYGWGFQPSDIAKLILQQEFEKDGRPPISIEVSGNLSEFVAYQDIPDFGAQFFYAYSPEHIRKWDNLDKAVIPRGLLNVTVVSSPDTSILARSLEKKQPKTEEDKDAVCPGQEPEDKKKTKPCPPKAKEDAQKGKGPAKPAAKPGIKPRRIIKKRVVAKMPPLDTSRIEGPMNWVESREEYDARIKSEQMAKMPARLRARLKKKPAEEDIIEEEGPCEPCVPQPPCPPQPPCGPAVAEEPCRPESPDLPGVVKTPDLFYEWEGRRGPCKEYGMQDFLLDQDEEFVPATERFRDLEYEPPPPAERTRRSPVQRRQPEMTPVREPPCPEPRSRDVAESFDRSYQAMMAQREPQPPPPGLTPKHMAIWERLQKLKEAQLQPPRRLVFDEAEISVDQDNVSYEHMVYTEFPDEDKTPSILADTAMGYSDVFGESRIAQVDALPAPAQEDLDKAELILAQEMENVDHYEKSKLPDADVCFEDIAVEKEEDGPCPKKVKVGKRKLDVHGEQPLVETYMEESNQPLFDETLKDDGDYTPPISESVLNVILDKKLKELQPTPPSPPSLPPVYGEWASDFMRGVERIERDEDVDQLSDISAPAYYSSDFECSTAGTDPWERARRAGISPTRVALAQSVKASADFIDLRDRFRAQKGLSPVREAIDYPQMGEYLQYNELDVCEETPPYYTAPTDYTDTDYIPPEDRSYLLESEMETDDVFGPRAVCEPSPVFAAKLKAQTERFEDIKTKFEVGKARRIHRDRAQRAFDEQDLLEPYHYQSFPEAGLGPLDSSIDAECLHSPLIQAPPTPKRGRPLESFEQQLDESLQFFEPVDSFSREGVPCPFPDYDFLERRICDEVVPAEGSLMAEDEMMTEDIFGEEAIGEPCPVRQLPAPPPPPTTVSPVKYSHLYYVGTPPCKPGFKYKMTKEALEDVSCPNEMLTETLEITEEEVCPEVPPQGPPEEIRPEHIYQHLRLEKPPFEGEFDPDRECLAPDMMDTSDIFGEDAVASPKRKRISPTKLICARAAQQTDQIKKLRNRFRALRGLPPLPSESRDYEKMVEPEGPDLMGGLADAEYAEPPFGIMDEPILEECLQRPLMAPPKKKDLFESYEKTIFDSIFRDMVDGMRTPGESMIECDEMDSDPFAGEMIAEPVPVKDIPMPPASPPRRIYSHLYDDATPETPIPEKYRPRIERLEEVSEPEYDSAFDRSVEPTPPPPQPPCEQFAQPMPPPMPAFDAGKIQALAATLEEDDVLEFLRMPRRSARGEAVDESVLDRVLQRFAILRGHVDRPGDDFSILGESAMSLTDMFGEEAVMAPADMEMTPTKALLAKSVQQSKDFDELRNRFRALRGLPVLIEDRSDPIEALKDREGYMLEPIKFNVQEAPFGIMDEPILEDQRAALIQSPQKTDPFDSFERGLMHSWVKELEKHGKSFEIPRDSQGNELDLSFRDMSFVKSPPIFPKFSTPAVRAREYGRATYGRSPSERLSEEPCPQPQSREGPMRSLLEQAERTQLSQEPCLQDFEEYPAAQPCPEEVGQMQLSAEPCPAEFAQSVQPILSPDAYPERFDLGEYAAEWPPRLSAETFPDALIDSHEYDTPCYDQPLSAESFPEGFESDEGEPPFLSSVAIFKEIGKEQTKRIHDLRNRYREKQGLPPLVDLADEEESIGEIHPDITPVDEPPCERFQFDFDTVERQFDESRRLSAERRIYGSPDQILSEGEMLDFDEEDICAPMPIRELPMPSALPTPPPPSPVKYSHLYEMDKSPVRVCRPPRERKPQVPCRVDTIQAPPNVPESPERQLSDISEPEVFSRLEDFEESIYSLGDLTPSRAHKIGLSPTRLLLAQSVKASANYADLRDRFRQVKGMSPVTEKVDYPQMGEYLEYQEGMYDRYAPVEFPEHEPHLLDEPIWDVLRPPLEPPRKDPFASFEKEMDEHPSMFSTALSILGTDEMEDMFDSDMVEEPCPIGEIPMPRPCDMTPPPPCSPPWHLFNISPPYQRPVRGALPAERLDSETFPSEYDSAYDVCEPTPPGQEGPCPSPGAPKVDSPMPAPRADTPIQIARAVAQSQRIADYKAQFEVGKARRIQRTGQPAPYTYQTPPPRTGAMDDLLSPTEFGDYPCQKTILDESLESGTYQTPLVGPPYPQQTDRLQFHDSLGPPEIPDSPGGFNIKEVCPGYYVPAREKDKQRFAEFQKEYIAGEYGMDVADLSGEFLADISPPPSPRRTPDARPPCPPRSAGVPSQPCPRTGPAPAVCPSTPVRPRTPQRPIQPLQQRLDVCQPSPPQPTRSPARPNQRLEEIFKSVASGAPQPLPIGMDPATRIRRLLAQAPRFEIEALPSKSEYEPTEYVAKILPPAEDLLEEEEFPCDALPSDELYGFDRFGDYYHALYIPTEQEELENQQRFAAQAAQAATLESEICQPVVCPQPPVSPGPRPCPTYLPDLSPSQEGFKWLDNFVPMEQNFPQPICEPSPPPPVCEPLPEAPMKKKRGQPPAKAALPPGKQKLKRPPLVQAPPPKKVISKKLEASASRLAQPKVIKKKSPVRPEPEKKVISKTRMQASASRLSQAKKQPEAGPVCPVRGAAPPGRASARQSGQRTGPPTRQSGATGQRPSVSSQAGARPPTRKGSVTKQTGPPVRQSGAPGDKSGPPTRQASVTGQRTGPPSRQSGAPGQQPGPPARQTGVPGTRPGPSARQTGVPGTRPGPPARQTGVPGTRPGPPGRRPCPARQAGPSAQRPGPPVRQSGAPGQRPCPARQAGAPGQRPCPARQAGAPGQRPCPARQAGAPGQRPGPPARQAGTPGQRPCPAARQAGTRPCPSAGPSGRRPLSPVVERTAPVSPYDIKRRQGMHGEIQPVLEGGPVPIVTTRNAPGVPMTGPRIYMPAEAIIEREKRLAQRGAKVCPAQAPTKPIRPAKTLSKSAVESVSRLAEPKSRPPCPAREKAALAKAAQKPPMLAGKRPGPTGRPPPPCPAGRKESVPTPARGPASRPQAPPGAPMKRAQREGPPTRPVQLAPRKPVQTRAPSPPQQQQICPPRLPPRTGPLPPSVPLPLTGEIRDVLEGGPVPIVTTRNANQMQSGPRIYMPAEAILERQQRFAQREANARAAQEAAAMMAQRTARDLQARAGIKVPAMKKSTSVTKLPDGRTAVVKKTSSMGTLGGCRAEPSRLSRQDKTRRR